MKKCKHCGCDICHDESRVVVTTGKLFKRKREFFHVPCFIVSRKQKRDGAV